MLSHYPDSKRKDRAGRVTQVVKNLPSQHEALSLNPSTTATKRTKYSGINVIKEVKYL
jgi:hypothetical protein